MVKMLEIHFFSDIDLLSRRYFELSYFPLHFGELLCGDQIFFDVQECPAFPQVESLMSLAAIHLSADPWGQ